MSSLRHDEVLGESMRNVIEQRELVDILEQRRLSAVFQPILDSAQHQVLGYEALIRGPVESPLHSPLRLLAAAQSCHRLFDTEYLAIQTAIESFAALRCGRERLFLNVSPQVLVDLHRGRADLVACVLWHRLECQEVILELSEMHRVEEFQPLLAAVSHFRELGFTLALDDYGSGFSNAKMWSLLKPEFVKVDRYFIQDIDTDETKRGYVRALVDFARGAQTSLIFEGIETESEFVTLTRCGMRFGQGYLLGRPNTELSEIPVLALPMQPAAATQGPTAQSLLLPVPPLVATDKAVEAMEYFESHPDAGAVAVVDKQGAALGLLTRQQLLELFSKNYGRELNGRRRLHELVDRGAHRVEHDTSLARISREVTDHHGSHWYFIISRNGRYLGLGSVRDLLKRVTDEKLRHARYANPLTMLPGNVPIFERIDTLLASHAAFHVAYFDLNNFKPYNDVYGYSHGDEVIKLVASLLTQYCAGSANFVGHLGGDDFIVVFSDSDWRNRCDKLLVEFNRRVRRCYSEQDLHQGGIHGVARDGNHQFFPILTLAVGVVNPDPLQCQTHHDVAELATSAKHLAKQRTGGGLHLHQGRAPLRNRRARQSVA